MINQTLNKLHSMNLKAMEEEYRRQLELSISNSLSFDERLAMMVDAQWLAKANSRLKRLLREANLGNPRPAWKISTMIRSGIWTKPL